MGHLSKARKSFSQLKHGKAYSSLYQWTKPNGFLVDRNKMEKFRKKRRLVRKDAVLPDVKYPEEDEEEEGLRERGEEPYAETPLSPSSEGDAQSSTGRGSAWDSDTPSNPPYPAAAPEEQSLVQTVGKRTIIRQGKQVVFRDEDGSGDDEDIMVDSGNPCGNLSPSEPRMKMAGSRRGEGSVGLPGPWKTGYLLGSVSQSWWVLRWVDFNPPEFPSQYPWTSTPRILQAA